MVICKQERILDLAQKLVSVLRVTLKINYYVPNVWEEDPTPTPTPTQTPTQTPTPTDTPITLEWKQLGEDIDGEASNDRSGWSVDTNAVGDRVIIGVF